MAVTSWIRRQFKNGVSTSVTIPGGLTAGATSFSVNSGGGSTFPDGTVGPFIVTVDQTLASEEKILVQSRTTDAFTVATNGRGYNGTTAQTHGAGATIYHTIDAQDFDEANQVAVQTLGAVAASGDLLVGSGANTLAKLAKGATNSFLQAGASTLAWAGFPTGVTASVGTANTDGTQTVPARADHAHAGLGQPLALTGATSATRYAGATTSGAPASGTFAVGDFVIDQTGIVWICTVAGTPGTWKSSGTHLMARYTRSAAFSPAAGSPNIPVLVYDALNYDTAGIYSVSTGMFTVPLAGVWRFEAQIGYQTDATHPVTPRIGLVATTSSSTALIEGPRQNIPVSVTAACVVSAELNLAANATVGVGQMGPIATGETGLTDPSITWVTARYVGTAS